MNGVRGSADRRELGTEENRTRRLSPIAAQVALLEGAAQVALLGRVAHTARAARPEQATRIALLVFSPPAAQARYQLPGYGRWPGPQSGPLQRIIQSCVPIGTPCRGCLLARRTARRDDPIARRTLPAAGRSTPWMCRFSVSRSRRRHFPLAAGGARASSRDRERALGSGGRGFGDVRAYKGRKPAASSSRMRREC
jgi:hypothetical protein